jgi:NADPH-dependent curcumin reductase
MPSFDPLIGILNMADRSPTPLLSSRDEHGVAQRRFVQAEEKTVGERIARSIVLAAHPDGHVKESDLRFETLSVPEPGENEILLETQYLSLEPYMRARMEAVKSYTAHLEIGDVMIGQSVARVIVSRHPQFQAGDIVLAWTGWRTLSLSNGENVRKLDPDVVPPTSWLGILGFAGFAAYVGLREIAPPAPGETVVVAAASGGVGSLVGQLARKAGARAVGIAGGSEKCSYIKEAFGFEQAVDHRAPDLDKRLAAACPNGVDVYFENVGGDVFTAVWPLLNQNARISICGLVGQFGTSPPPGPDRLPSAMRQILSKNLTIRGLLTTNYPELRGDFEKEIIGGLRDGTIRQREDITDGFDETVRAFMRMLDGRSFGKSVVRVAT